jgi:hypothetical protein
MDYRIHRLRVVTERDEGAQPDDPKYGDPAYRQADAERVASYQRGDWTYVGVRVEVVVSVEGVTQTLSSAGLWHIESDSDPSYLDEVAQEEYAVLKNICRALGIQRLPPLAEAEKVTS